MITEVHNEIRVTTWEECVAKVAGIKQDHPDNADTVCFRGQSDSSWPLTTTLERRNENRSYTFLEYYRLMLRTKPEIESTFGERWEIPSFEDFNEWSRSWDHKHYTFMAYEFLAHLRHNGFPSPLLDWSSSLYVAAYFAFTSAALNDVAIYAYLEMPNRMKGSSSDQPAIRALGPIVRTNRRHFRQQSRYTICAQYDADTFDGHKSWRFVPHQEVFNQAPTRQDLLWKIVIPASERMKVLSHLDEFSLNAFSLFGSEESLMETLAFREIDRKPPGRS